METKVQIGILGAGGQAEEIASYIGHPNVYFFAVDPQYIDDNNPKHVDLLDLTLQQKETPVVAGIGAPGLRRRFIEKWSGFNFATVRSPEAYIDQTATIGEGSVVAPGSIITTNVEIGKHALINIAATISHNARLGDFVTVSPGARIAGDVVIEDGVFIGIGAVISNRTRIARGSVIGAGAVVVEDIAIENSVVRGVPARLSRINDDWLYEI